MSKQLKGSLMDTSATYFVMLGATSDRGAKFGLADDELEVKNILASWKTDGLSGEYAIFANRRVGNL